MGEESPVAVVPEPKPDKAALKPKRRWLRGCAMAALGLLLLLLLFAVGWVLHIRHQEKKLHLRIAALLAEAEAARPQVPEAENAAPLYRQAFALLQDRELLDGLSTKVKELGDAFDFTSPEVNSYLSGKRAFLTVMKRAASFRNCTFRPNYLVHDEGWLFDGKREAGHAINCLSLAGLNAAAAGRPEEAIELSGLLLRFGNHIGQDGTLLCLMFEKSTEGNVAGLLQSALNHAEPDVASLTRMLSAIESFSVERWDFSHTIRISKLSTMRTFEAAMRGELKFSVPDEEAFPDNGRDLKQAAKIGRWTGLIFTEFRTMDATYDRLAEAATLPCPDCLDGITRIKDEVGQRFEEHPITGGMVMTKSSIGAMVMCLEDAVARSTSLDAARLGLACRLRRLKFGAYPQTLAELSAKLPEHFKELPADPFTGKPFLYKRTAAGCQIWSVGKDRADDGGDAKKDIVFELKK